MNFQILENTREYDLQRLQAVADANWTYQYLTSEGDVKARCCLWRFVQWIKLDQLPWIRNMFPKADIENAATSLYSNIRNIVEIDAENITEETQNFLNNVAKKINTLIFHINSKRVDNKIAESAYITVPKHLIFDDNFSSSEEVVENTETLNNPTNTYKVDSEEFNSYNSKVIHVDVTPQQEIIDENFLLESHEKTPPLEEIIENAEIHEKNPQHIYTSNSEGANSNASNVTRFNVTPQYENLEDSLQESYEVPITTTKPKKVAKRHQKRLTKEQLQEMKNNKHRAEIIEIEKKDN